MATGLVRLLCQLARLDKQQGSGQGCEEQAGPGAGGGTSADLDAAGYQALLAASSVARQGGQAPDVSMAHRGIHVRGSSLKAAQRGGGHLWDTPRPVDSLDGQADVEAGGDLRTVLDGKVLARLGQRCEG